MLKRAFDIVAAGLALVLLAPLLVLIALLVALGSPGGAFFRQVRVGRGEREFRILKFRTMRLGSEAQGQITVGGRDARITSIGLLLRKAKLDELPQLWNVLVGEMSIVGPRPEVPRYVALYSDEQRQVLALRPGLTSLASLSYIDENEVLGRATDPERTYIQEVMPAKLALDLKYAHEQSLVLDLHIIARTALRLFIR